MLDPSPVGFSMRGKEIPPGRSPENSSDLVLAFQAGVYERPAIDSEVAAAVDWLFAQDGRATRHGAYVA